MKRTVITGLGIVSSIGSNQREVLASLCEGRSRITFSQELGDSGTRSHVWGNVKLNITGLIGHKVVRFVSDVSIYAPLSMEQTIVDTGLSPETYQSNLRVDLITDSDGGFPRFQVFGADAMCGSRGPKAVGPYMVTRAMASGVSACPTTPLKIHDVNYSINSARATSAHYIGDAVEQIQLGRQDIVFAGSGEGLCWETACEFDAMGALSTEYNDTPKKASRAYDIHRDSFVTTGGGGMVVVEEPEHALTRDARIYAEIVDYGTTSDGIDTVIPSGRGAVRCTKMAMYGVGTPIDYLNSHGALIPAGDVKEPATIREVFDDKSLATSATKAITGHSLGVTGVQEATYSLLMLGYGFITLNINIEELDKQAAGLNIVAEMTNRGPTTVMSNSFGFGDTNAMLVMHKLGDRFGVGRIGRISVVSDDMRQCYFRY